MDTVSLPKKLSRRALPRYPASRQASAAFFNKPNTGDFFRLRAMSTVVPLTGEQCTGGVSIDIARINFGSFNGSLMRTSRVADACFD
jgi:hypothetical protein